MSELNDHMKGISIPINVIVVVVIVALVLVVISSFFLSSTSTQMSVLEAEREFTLGCQNFCRSAPDLTECLAQITVEHLLGEAESEFNERFLEACAVLGYAQTEEGLLMTRNCIRACGKELPVDSDMPEF